MIELLPDKDAASAVICKGRSVDIIYPAGGGSGNLIAFAEMCENAFPGCVVTLRSGEKILAIYPSIHPEPLR